MRKRVLPVALLACTTPGSGADLAAGVAAFERKDYQAAVRELKPLADQGIARVEHYVGMMLDNGWGLPRDRQRAATLIRQSAEKGFVKAQAVMGFAHFTGSWLVGVEKSDAESLRWFRRAAEQGDSSALYQVRQRYEKGWGVGQDYLQALKWYQPAADNGHAHALGKIGIFYLRGRGLPQDGTKGIALMKAAFGKGDTEIALMLAEVYRVGDGTQQDTVQAYAWAHLATEVRFPGGPEFATRLRDEIGRALTAVQRQKAQRLAADWAKARR